MLNGEAQNTVHFLDTGGWPFVIATTLGQPKNNSVYNPFSVPGLDSGPDNRHSTNSKVSPILYYSVPYLHECWSPFCSSRCDHACVVIGHKMYIIGGSGGNDLWFNDFHMFNLESLEWIPVEMKGIPPQPRDYARLVNLNNWVSLKY